MGQLLEVLKGIKLPEGAKKVVIEADEIYSKRPETTSYIEHLEAKIKQLEMELERLRSEKGISNEVVGLTFNPTSGTHIDSSTGLHYCTKCLADKKRSPLKDEMPRGWRCMVCKTWYANESAPRPKVKTDYDPYDSGGPQGWMR